MSEAVKETKAQRVERLKRELNPWEAYADIQRFAREGWDAVPPEWLGTYFRWWGIYTQGDGVGAVGGKGGEGKATRRFMVRIRIPNGALESHQLRTIADLAERHGRGVADITVRENVQLHWVPLESLPAVFQALWLQGVTTMGACGDVTRNVTGCPVAGLDADELADASPLVLEATRMLNGNPAFYNLPRKFKVSIAGCRAWCTYPEINDIGLTTVRHPETGEIGFSVRVGGGLSTDPHLGVRLDAFVPWGRALAVVLAIAEVFRDSDVLRQNRERARLKFLFLQHGWTPERFKQALEERLGSPLEPGVPDDPPDDVYRDHVGIHDQKQPGYCYAGVAVLRGRLTAAQMLIAADLAERYGTGALRTTSMQNLMIPNVPRARAGALARELEAADFALDASPFRRGTVACTGSEFCKLALTETKGFARGLVETLERRLPGFDQHLRINVTGCPNSCGQHWIADLGIEGKKIKVDGTLVDAYYFCVGGAVGSHQAVARPIGLRLPATAVAQAIERLLRGFLSDRHPSENFRQFAARHTDDELRALLAGELVEAVARDAAPERPPHGVDG
ncbi:MAG: nitrite reductase [Candidatus Rokuibacteriota bacterium]|nr:MAG: nitrite reductase [Candidatus Rokubacteria bacterium]